MVKNNQKTSYQKPQVGPSPTQNTLIIKQRLLAQLNHKNLTGGAKEGQQTHVASQNYRQSITLKQSSKLKNKENTSIKHGDIDQKRQNSQRTHGLTNRSQTFKVDDQPSLYQIRQLTYLKHIRQREQQIRLIQRQPADFQTLSKMRDQREITKLEHMKIHTHLGLQPPHQTQKLHEQSQITQIGHIRYQKAQRSMAELQAGGISGCSQAIPKTHPDKPQLQQQNSIIKLINNLAPHALIGATERPQNQLNLKSQNLIKKLDEIDHLKDSQSDHLKPQSETPFINLISDVPKYNHYMSDGDSEEELDDEFYILPELANSGNNELQLLQSQCFRHREELCHRFYRYHSIFEPKDDQQSPKKKPANLIPCRVISSRPHKTPKHNQIIFGITEKAHEENYNRQQDQFKSYKQLEKVKSQLERKHKSVGLILGESSKQTKKSIRKDKDTVSHPSSKAVNSAPSKLMHQKDKSLKVQRLKKFFPCISVQNPYLMKVIRRRLKAKYIALYKRKYVSVQKKLTEKVEEQSASDSNSNKASSSSSNSNEESDQNNQSTEKSSFVLPKHAQKRVGRWTHKELNSLKLAMTLFGDQRWKKIQEFLVYREKEQKKSRTITKQKNKTDLFSSGTLTYRSVKAIQSKIYQIKPRVESEIDYIKKVFNKFDPENIDRENLMAIVPSKCLEQKEDIKSTPIKQREQSKTLAQKHENRAHKTPERARQPIFHTSPEVIFNTQKVVKRKTPPSPPDSACYPSARKEPSYTQINPIFGTDKLKIASKRIFKVEKIPRTRSNNFGSRFGSEQQIQEQKSFSDRAQHEENKETGRMGSGHLGNVENIFICRRHSNNQQRRGLSQTITGALSVTYGDYINNCTQTMQRFAIRAHQATKENSKATSLNDQDAFNEGQKQNNSTSAMPVINYQPLAVTTRQVNNLAVQQ